MMMANGDNLTMKRLAASAVVGACGIFGLFVAAGAGHGGGYGLGLLLFAASVVFVFWMLKQHFDGVPESRMLDVWAERPRSGWIQVVVFGALGLLGLFLAARGDIYLYWFGICLFAVCCVMGLLAMKAIYDQRDRTGRKGR